jgi:hypothetical protein
LERNRVSIDFFGRVAEIGERNPVSSFPIHDRTSGIPESLAKVVDRALLDKPELYYKTAAEFKGAIAHF